MAKIGRPTDYTEDLSDRICSELANGNSLRTVCRADDMPDRTTVFRWIRTIPDFQHHYADAKQEAADAMGEDILDIADETTDKDGHQRNRLRVDTRKWLMSKHKPKKYGDKIDMTSGDKPISFTVVRGEAKGSDAEDSDA